MNHEESTMELRQVWHEAWRQTAKGDTAYFGYYVTQRKWYVYEGAEYVGPFNLFEREDALFVMFDTDRTKAIWQPRRVEWRDLPIVDAKDAK
jgi:hypothetical protein